MLQYLRLSGLMLLLLPLLIDSFIDFDALIVLLIGIAAT